MQHTTHTCDTATTLTKGNPGRLTRLFSDSAVGFDGGWKHIGHLPQKKNPFFCTWVTKAGS